MTQRGTKPAWAGDEIRLDPYLLPQKVSFARRGGSAGCDNHHSGETSVQFTVDVRGAVMRRQLDCGLPLSMALPARAFHGVAARAYENEDGSNTVTLELMHSDAEMSVPLLVSSDMDDVAADWHSWSRTLRLPMLIVEADGLVREVKPGGFVIATGEPKPRRRQRFSIKHRPNFLRRRKTGTVSAITRLSPQEIIARS